MKINVKKNSMIKYDFSERSAAINSFTGSFKKLLAVMKTHWLI